VTDILSERVHAELDEPFVVFVVGMRINSLRRVRAWLPVFRVMPRMLRELDGDAEDARGRLRDDGV
jgi:hypothetical protein